jgi:protein-tyrosine phosphatase
MNSFNRHLPIKGTYNVRDLGGYVTPAGETRWRRILRADGLHRLDGEGMEALVAEGVTTVIDLRHSNELAQQPNPFAAADNVAYHNVSLFEDLAPTPKPGEDLLLELYIRALETRQPAIAQVLTIIADAPTGTVLFHCTAGKDRTGIISALLLGLAGVGPDTIVADYALTAEMIAPMVEEIITNAAARGADVESFRPLLASEPSTMVATIAHIEANHASVGAYVEKIGVPAATVERLRARLTGDL